MPSATACLHRRQTSRILNGLQVRIPQPGTHHVRTPLLIGLLLLGATEGLAAQSGQHLNVPFDHYALKNGLRVVLSRDTTAPTVGVGVYYHIGFRNEPR